MKTLTLISFFAFFFYVSALCQTTSNVTNTNKNALIDTSFTVANNAPGIVVVEFSISAYVNGFMLTHKAKGNRITQTQRDLIQSLKVGDRVYFDDIKARTPSGTIKELQPVVFRIQ